MSVWRDGLFLLAECLCRQFYWNWPGLRRWRQSVKRREKPRSQQCRREELLRHLEKIGVTKGALVMVHTGMDGVRILDQGGQPYPNAVAQAQMLLEDFMELIGPEGTLVMPTHAKYQTDESNSKAGTEHFPTYDVRHSPCGIGLTNELFWRRKGVKRSLFPHNMLAACGPLADELLRDNLNDRKPSPHGVDSGYYRICKHNGLVVSVGVPLREYITIAHVVEEVRLNWPIRDFFTERRYRVMQDGSTKEWTVRLRREDYAKFCYCREKMGRDMVAEGVIQEGHVGTLRVDWAKAGKVYDFFWRKTANRPYPYYGLWLIRKPKC